MIKKYINFLNEKLSDKLSGFNADELKRNFLINKLDFFKYLKLCKEHGIELPTDKEINNYYLTNLINYEYLLDYYEEYKNDIDTALKVIETQFLNHRFYVYTYLSILENYDKPLPHFDIIENLFYDKNLNLKELAHISYYYYKKKLELKELRYFMENNYCTVEEYIDVEFEYYKIKPTYMQLEEYLENNKINKEEFDRIIKKYNIEKVFY